MRYSISILFLYLLMSASITYGYAQPPLQGFGKRAEYILNHTADHYKPPSIKIGDPEKYYWPLVIARFERYGVADSIANHWINEMAGNSPFHFTLVGMARLLYQYPHAPAIQQHYDLILQKVFDRRDSYNAWTGEGTENHVNMSRASGYLFAQAALLRRADFPEAQNHLGEMDLWLRYWSKEIFKMGTGEWNSSTYLAYNLVGWLNLYDFSKDGEMKKIAKAVLDYYASELALHYSFGSIGGSEMRGSNSTLHSATSYLGWLWFGSDDDYYSKPEGLTGSQFIQCVHAATSTYRPPVTLNRLAQKQDAKPALYQNSQPAYLLEQPSFVKQFFYTTPDFTLGSANSRFGGYTGTTSQIVSWKLVARQKPGELPVEILGNGMYYKDMPLKGRDPYTQLVQHNNILIQLTCVPATEANQFTTVQTIVEKWSNLWQHDFDLRFPQDSYKKNIVNLRENRSGINGSFLALPVKVAMDSSGTTVWINAGDTFLAIRSVSGRKLKSIQKNDKVYFVDQSAPGELCGIILEACRKSEVKDFESFVARVTRQSRATSQGKTVKYTTSKGDLITATYVSNGSMTEAISDWGYGKIAPHPKLTSPPLTQPTWPAGEGWGKVPRYRISKKEIDLQKVWPVWQGEYLHLDKSILKITDGHTLYEINYQGNSPVFMETDIKASNNDEKRNH